LHLRIDNADRRLTPHGRRVGLINDDAWADYLAKQERMRALTEYLEKTRASSEMLQKIDAQLPSAIVNTLAQLLKRPEMKSEHLIPLSREAGGVKTGDWLEIKSVETEIKYAGYLEQQQRSIERLKKAEQRNIPEWFDYQSVSGLSREMHEKLTRVRPRTIGQ